MSRKQKKGKANRKIVRNLFALDREIEGIAKELAAYFKKNGERTGK